MRIEPFVMILSLAINKPCATAEAGERRQLARAIVRPALRWTVAACGGILFARRPDMVLNPQFWAEDGPVFFAQARIHGIAALVEPYAGYFHTVLRLVAWIA